MKCPERELLYVNKAIGYTMYNILNPTQECKDYPNYHTAVGLGGYICFEPFNEKGKQSKLEIEVENDEKSKNNTNC